MTTRVQIVNQSGAGHAIRIGFLGAYAEEAGSEILLPGHVSRDIYLYDGVSLILSETEIPQDLPPVNEGFTAAAPQLSNLLGYAVSETEPGVTFIPASARA